MAASMGEHGSGNVAGAAKKPAAQGESQEMVETLEAEQVEEVDQVKRGRDEKLDTVEAMEQPAAHELALSQLAAQLKAQSDTLKAMRKEQVQHGKLATLHTAYILASAGEGSFSYRNERQPNEEISSSEFVCSTLCSIIQGRNAYIPHE